MRGKNIFILLLLLIVLPCGMMTAEEVKTDDIGKLFKKIQLFSDALSLIRSEYVQPVKITDLVHGAIKGMMGKLDKYSKFLDADQYKEITEETKGEFGGIGVQVGIREEILTVLKVMESTPAEKAGIMKKDRIVSISGKTTEDESLDDSVDLMRGDPGTYLDMSIYREKTEELIDLHIKRALIKLKSIKDVKKIGTDIGYLRLAEFQERTAKDIKKVIKDFQEQGLENIILDLRGNPGGLLDASVEVADLFLEQGLLIVYTKGRDPDTKVDFLSKKEPVFKDLNIVLLINGKSASAAEILAGALKDNGKALLVGTTSFGKGSVQTVIPLQDGSGLRLTTAAYFTPSGKNLMDKGIDPDVIVKKQKIIKNKKSDVSGLKEKIFEKVEQLISPEYLPENEDIVNKEDSEPYDNQLQAAVNILRGASIFNENKMKCENLTNSVYTSKRDI